MKSKILVSLLVIVVCVSMVAGATMAWFTDSATSTGNTFTAGTINVDINAATNRQVILGDISKIAPGDVTTTASITIKNTGNLDAATFGRFTVSDDGYNMASWFDFYEYKVEYFDANGNTKARWGNSHDNYWGATNYEDYFIKQGVWGGSAGYSTKLSDWVTGFGLDVGPWDAEGLKPGESYVLTFQLKFNENAADVLQGKSFKLGFETKASQPTLGAVESLGINTSIVSYIRTQLGL